MGLVVTHYGTLHLWPLTTGCYVNLFLPTDYRRKWATAGFSSGTDFAQ